MNETLNTIMTRRSCRQYQNECIKEDELITILEAGIQAPSAMNQQLCEAFAIINKDLIDELAKAIKDVFDERGDKKPETYHCAYHAPVLVIVSGPEYDSRRVEDGSCMLENMFLAATAEGLACSMRIPVGEEGKNVADILGAPENYLLPCYIGLGYPAEDKPEVEQVQYTAEQKMHLGKW